MTFWEISYFWHNDWTFGLRVFCNLFEHTEVMYDQILRAIEHVDQIIYTDQCKNAPNMKFNFKLQLTRTWFGTVQKASHDVLSISLVFQSLLWSCCTGMVHMRGYYTEHADLAGWWSHHSCLIWHRIGNWKCNTWMCHWKWVSGPELPNCQCDFGHVPKHQKPMIKNFYADPCRYHLSLHWLHWNWIDT